MRWVTTHHGNRSGCSSLRGVAQQCVSQQHCSDCNALLIQGFPPNLKGLAGLEKCLECPHHSPMASRMHEITVIIECTFAWKWKAHRDQWLQCFQASGMPTEGTAGFLDPPWANMTLQTGWKTSTSLHHYDYCSAFGNSTQSQALPPPTCSMFPISEKDFRTSQEHYKSDHFHEWIISSWINININISSWIKLRRRGSYQINFAVWGGTMRHDSPLGHVVSSDPSLTFSFFTIIRG